MKSYPQLPISFLFFKGIPHMNIIVNRASLVAALALLATVVRKLSPKPILACVKLSARDRTLQISGTDLEQTLMVQVHEVQVEAEGDVLINLDELLTTLKSSQEHVVYLRCVSDQGEPQLRVADDDAEFFLPTFPPADYPPLPLNLKPVTAEGFCATSEQLVKAIDHVAWAVA